MYNVGTKKNSMRSFLLSTKTHVKIKANLKIILSPLTRPCFTGMGRTFGKFLYQIGYQIKLNCIQ